MPQLLHRIWFGSFLPTKYQENLIQFAQHNPESAILLWTDFATISESEQQECIEFCQTHHFELRNIRNSPELTNIILIQEELGRAQHEPKHRLIHLVRAADLARVAILIEHGGIYTDTDTVSVSPLPTLSLPLGFLAQSDIFAEYEIFKTLDSVPYFDKILYDFMAAEPQNNLLNLAAKISELDYQTYHNSVNKQWECSEDREIHLYSTIRLTGSSVRYAINYLIAHGEISVKNLDDLFFKGYEYLRSTYDKSWLEGYDNKPDNDEKASMELFRAEIETQRDKQFPCALPSTKLKQDEFEIPRIKFDPTCHFYLQKDILMKPLTPLTLGPLKWSPPEYEALKWSPPEYELPQLKLKPLIYKEADFMSDALHLLENYIENNQPVWYSFWICTTQLNLIKSLAKDIKTKRLTSSFMFMSQLNELANSPNNSLSELIGELGGKSLLITALGEQRLITNERGVASL